MDTDTDVCYAERSREGYWTCDVPGGCSECRRLAHEARDKYILLEWATERTAHEA